MYRNNIYIKNLLICLVVCLTVLAVCLVPSLLPKSTTTNEGNWIDQTTTTPSEPAPPFQQPSYGPAVFATGASSSEMAETLLGATATVVIINKATNTSAGFGSGVAVAENGYMVTNYHVVAKVVTQPTKYGITLHMMVGDTLTKNISAELLWYSDSLDMAILKSSVNFKTYAQMADRWINSTNKLKIAEDVWTLGTPAELSLWGSYSEGTISSQYPRVTTTFVDPYTYVHNYLIQHNAAISSGNSGGPLFDKNGFLLGLNTCGQASSSSITATNLFFAVPIYPITIVLDTVIEKYDLGQRYTAPTIGIEGYDKDWIAIKPTITLTDDGFYVEKITTGSRAEFAGLPADIVIKGIGGENCTGSSAPDYFAINRTYDLVYAMLHYETGDKITIFYEQESEIKSIVLEL